MRPRFFRLNGMASVHHDNGRLVIAMGANLRAGRHVLASQERFEAFLDMSFLRPHVHVEIYRRWEAILEQLPEARFVLHLRDVDRWVESRLAMGPWREWRWERPARGFGSPWDDALPGPSGASRRSASATGSTTGWRTRTPWSRTGRKTGRATLR